MVLRPQLRLLTTVTAVAIGLAGCGGGGAGVKHLASVDGGVTSTTDASAGGSDGRSAAPTTASSSYGAPGDSDNSSPGGAAKPGSSRGGTSTGDGSSTGDPQTPPPPPPDPPPPPKPSVKRARMPGPPAPNGPIGFPPVVDNWYTLLATGNDAGQCQPVLDAVASSGLQPATTGVGQYVHLYKGMAEGCLGQTAQASSDLEQALQVGLLEDGSRDSTCHTQELLASGFETYLDKHIDPVCP